MTIRKWTAAALAVAVALAWAGTSQAAFKDWSTTAATNSTADATILWSEGQAPSTVNDSARAMMAALASWRDLVDYGTVSNCTVGGSGNAVTLVCSPTVVAREAGRRYLFAAGAGNTTTATLTVDSTTVGTIQWKGVALVSGDIATGDIIVVEDDGTNFQLLTVPRISLFGGINGLTADGTGATGDYFATYDVSTSLPKKVLFSTYQTLMAASAAQQETGSSAAVNVTPSVQQRHDSATKAWINFNGTGTPTARDSYNVSSITDNGVGDYTINFTTAFSGATYAFSCTVGDAGANVVVAYVGTAAPTASAFRVRTYDLSAAGFTDPVWVACSFSGDQ